MEKKSAIQPLSAQIRAMEVGERVEFPLKNLSTVRVYACVQGLQDEKKFTTSINKENKTIAVTRIS